MAASLRSSPPNHWCEGDRNCRWPGPLSTNFSDFLLPAERPRVRRSREATARARASERAIRSAGAGANPTRIVKHSDLGRRHTNGGESSVLRKREALWQSCRSRALPAVRGFFSSFGPCSHLECLSWCRLLGLQLRSQSE